VFWLTSDRLVPEATGDSCADRPELVVQQLLGALVAGPSEQARAARRSSAIPPDSGLDLVSIVDGTVQVAIEPETSLSAERLPVAVGQIVLTVTSAPTVRSVVLVADGEPVQVPLPGGVLTDGPVTGDDYSDLLPDRFRTPRSFGCP
jgi:spore germination protein GerM